MDYYEYNAGSEPFWWIKTPPERNLRFEKELERLAGTNYFGDPILRVDWAGTLMSDVSFKPQLKFRKIWHGLTHFTYYDDGNLITIHREDEAPKDKFVIPVYQTLELGRLRWVVSKWQSVEDAVRSGRFDPETKGEDGKRLFCSPPPKGVYNAFFFVETADGRFRDLDNEVLEAVKAIWHYNENTSLDKKVADFEADEERRTREGNEAAKAVWQL